MIVLDAGVLIASLDAEDAERQTAESLLAREIDDEFAGNPLTLVEVLVGPTRADRLDTARSALWDLEVSKAPFPLGTAVRLARLRYGLAHAGCWLRKLALVATNSTQPRSALVASRIVGLGRRPSATPRRRQPGACGCARQS